MEEILFQYPIAEEQDLAREIIAEQTNMIKIKFAVMLLVLIGSILLGTNVLLRSIKLQTFFVILSIAIFFIAYSLTRIITRQIRHMLIINAYETYMELEILDTAKTYTKQKIHLKYNDIKMCILSKKYDKATIFFSEGASSYDICTDKNGKEHKNIMSGQITLDINPYTFEQSFFLYTARRLFTVGTKEWQIIKKFGSEGEYYEKYLSTDNQ